MYKYKWCEFILASSLGWTYIVLENFAILLGGRNFGAWNEFWCLDHFLLSWIFLIGKIMMVGYTLIHVSAILMLLFFYFCHIHFCWDFIILGLICCIYYCKVVEILFLDSDHSCTGHEWWVNVPRYISWLKFILINRLFCKTKYKVFAVALFCPSVKKSCL